MRRRIRVLGRVLASTTGVALCALISSQPAQAFRFDTGNPDFKISWDNTIKYSAAMRLGERSDKLTDPGRNIDNANQDDGDRNFGQGLISNRLDLFSELDASYKAFGVRLSGAAWYDTIYNHANDNDSASTANSWSKSHDEFTDDTRDLHGRKAEMLDTFAFGKIDAGPTTTSFRVGKFAQTWGESLFFGNNGIAGGMSPIDIVKLLSVPNTQFKEIIRPVPQVGAQLQIGPRVTFGGYYQFQWEKSVLPAVGSYFSTGDILDDGGERLLLGEPIHNLQLGEGPPTTEYLGRAPEAWFRGSDQQAKDSGQGGLQLKVRPGAGVDLGMYAIRYHDKTPQLYAKMYKAPGAPNQIIGLPPEAQPPVWNPGAVDPATGKSGEYYLTYPENIQAYGVSATTTFGDWNLATEVSMRRNAPLVSDLQAFPDSPYVTQPNNDGRAAYAVGRTVHAQFNWLAAFGPNFLSNESSFLGEVAWNKVTSVQDNPDAVAKHAERSAWGFRMVYEPSYRQVSPGLDLSVPVGFSYFPHGKSQAVGTFGPDKGGDMNVGLSAAYLDVWRFSLTYTHFYGPKNGYLGPDDSQTFQQSLHDRDFLAFSARRTF